MRPLQVVRLADVPAQPWRNGGGTTRELLAWPPGSSPEGWQLRVSVADITCDGPFSAFPGIERGFAVLEGAGVALTLPALGEPGPGEGQGAQDTRQLDPTSAAFVFDGAHAPGCRLVAGPTRDLNLMVRRDTGRVAMQRATPGSRWARGTAWRGLYTHGGASLATPAGRLKLPAACLAWCDACDDAAWHLVEGHHGWWLGLQPALASPASPGEHT
ncbi:MAG: hypothetical protein RI988_2645 [Pseudomonadota bacterium]